MSEYVAVTGATGFIGQSLCRSLQDEGWKIRALLRSESRARLLDGVLDEAVYGDLADPAALGRLVQNASAVVHCAGTVRGASQQQFDRVNAGGVQALVEAVSACPRPPRLLVLSSLAAREPALSFYAASKRKGEQVLEQQAGHLRWLALRPPAVYGPGDRELLPLFRLMAKGLAPVPGSREARFSMLYVEDLVAAIQAWLKSPAVPQGICSLHDGRQDGYDWDDVSAIVSRICQRKVYQVRIPPAVFALPALLNQQFGRWFGYAPMLTPGKLRELRHPDWVCDNVAISEALDWQPKLLLEDGLRATPGWCRAGG